MNTSDNSTARRGRVSIGQAAARSRARFEKLREEERLRQENYRQEREKLAREVAELEAQARRIQRDAQRQEERQACFALGRLVLDAMVVNGMDRFHITRAHLGQLKPKPLALVEAIVQRERSAQVEPAPGDNAPSESPPIVPDIEV